MPLTLLVNSLNRSLGQDDAYPFALAVGSLNKLRFIHDLIQSLRTGDASGQVDDQASPGPASAAPAAPALPA